MPVPVTIEPTEIEDVLVVKGKTFHDERGYFTEIYSRDMYKAAGFEQNFVQDNLSGSAKGTLRGMHYQILPDGMGKLVRCVKGVVFDVAVDLRRGSPTYGRWVGHELHGGDNLAMWIPVGFAHGFLALEDDSVVHYKCTAHHSPACERCLSYRCPKVGIVWPAPPTIISPKDASAPTLDTAEHNFVYQR